MAVTWSIRPAEPVDAESILAISDDAAAWLVDHGLSDQWGPEPPSSEPSFVSRVSSWIADGEAAVAVDANGDVHGYAIIGCLPPPYYDEAAASPRMRGSAPTLQPTNRPHPTPEPTTSR